MSHRGIGTRGDVADRCGSRRGEAGFSYVELMAAGALLLFSALGLAAVFVVAYAHVNGSGNVTAGLSAARQMLEDARRLPYDNMVNLNGLVTDNPATLPAADPELEVARRWRYALAGEGIGWSFTQTEKDRWTTFADQGSSLGAIGTVQVAAMSGTLSRITVTVSVPGSWRQIQMSTMITRLP